MNSESLQTTTHIDYQQGCQLAAEVWSHFNRVELFERPELAHFASPFPPPDLMQSVSGLVSERDFASHGADFYLALSAAAPKPLSQFASVLDFGCGVGRLARLLKGHPGRVAGCDIDRRHVEWVQQALTFMDASLSQVLPPIPYPDSQFELVISISIFTHLNETSQHQFLGELARVCTPGGSLMLTIHGERALERAVNEPAIRAMIAVDEARFVAARAQFAAGRHAFILQRGHLTSTAEWKSDLISEPFEYGISFIPATYIERHWSKWFRIEKQVRGGLHDFQDVLVLTPKK